MVTGLLRARTRDRRKKLDDTFIMAAMTGTLSEFLPPSKVAIDAPLGWPIDFVRGVADLDSWPVEPGADRSRLERRATDHWVRATTGKLPLSVTTDRIAYPAMRAAGLLARAELPGGIDRVGLTGVVCETYPDPAVRRLGLWPTDAGPRESYKRKARHVRDGIMRRLVAAAPWLEISDEHCCACTETDDCLDALVCALVARAVELGLTDGPPAELAREAQLEGWIHLPQSDAIAELV
jgi:hypothetical protein